LYVSDAMNALVTVTVAVSSTDVVAVAALTVNVSSVIAAEEGPTERTPRPSAATATSAILLKIVFVDIYFLSLVVSKTISLTAGKETFAS